MMLNGQHGNGVASGLLRNAKVQEGEQPNVASVSGIVYCDYLCADLPEQ